MADSSRHLRKNRTQIEQSRVVYRGCHPTCSQVLSKRNRTAHSIGFDHVNTMLEYYYGGSSHVGNVSSTIDSTGPFAIPLLLHIIETFDYMSMCIVQILIEARHIEAGIQNSTLLQDIMKQLTGKL